MTTATPTKKCIEETWTTKQIQEAAAAVVALHIVSANNVLAKHGDQALLAEYQNAVRKGKIEYYKALGVKTPIELITEMAKTDTNLFGSQIEITGDDTSATMNYINCALWNQMEKLTGKQTPEQQESFGASYQNCVSETAKAFGLKGDIKLGADTCAITFTK
jgi:hypothetical protein